MKKKSSQTLKATQSNRASSDQHALDTYQQMISSPSFWAYIDGLRTKEGFYRNKEVKDAFKSSSLRQYMNHVSLLTRRNNDFDDAAFSRFRKKLKDLKGVDICRIDDLEKIRRSKAND